MFHWHHHHLDIFYDSVPSQTFKSVGCLSSFWPLQKASGHKTDLEEVKMIDKKTCWYECEMKEAIWVWVETGNQNFSSQIDIFINFW